MLSLSFRYVRCFDRLFDIFNSKTSQHSDIFKHTLCRDNKDEVFSYLKSTAEYFKSLKIDVQRYRKDKSTGGTVKRKVSVPILKSQSKTAFIGFIIDAASLVQMYNEFVEKENLMESISTYTLQQDVVEMFFGKIRAKCGYNANPNVHQFKGAYRQLSVNSDIEISQHANCRYFSTELPSVSSFSNITTVSSKRGKFVPDQYFETDIEEQSDNILTDIQLIENNITDPYTDLSASFTAVHSAALIEKKMEKNFHFSCDQCRHVFKENVKFRMETLSTNVSMPVPCVSTFNICKTAERFMRLHNIKSSKPKYDFKMIYCLIFRTLDFENLYVDSPFDCDINHKYAFIKYIIGEYVSLTLSYKSRHITLEQHEKLLRKHLHTYLNVSGQ